MPLKKACDTFIRPVENDIDVIVPGSPRVLQQGSRCLFILGRQRIPQPIQRLAQRAAPFLVPAGVSASVASTITLPTLDSMITAPGAVPKNFYLMRRRILREVLTVVCQLGELLFFDVVQGVGQSHFTPVMVMAIAFAVRRNVDQLRPVAFHGRRCEDSLGELLAVIE